jgi:hypothetical protein
MFRNVGFAGRGVVVVPLVQRAGAHYLSTACRYIYLYVTMVFRRTLSSSWSARHNKPGYERTERACTRPPSRAACAMRGTCHGPLSPHHLTYAHRGVRNTRVVSALRPGPPAARSLQIKEGHAMPPASEHGAGSGTNLDAVSSYLCVRVTLFPLFIWDLTFTHDDDVLHGPCPWRSYASPQLKAMDGWI